MITQIKQYINSQVCDDYIVLSFLFYICLNFYNKLIHKYYGLIIISCFLNRLVLIYKFINEGDIMSKTFERQVHDDKNEFEKRKREFLTFNQLINADPFSSEYRNIISMLSDESMKEVRNIFYMCTFYKMLVDKYNNESNVLYKIAASNYEKIVKKMNILAKELNLSNSLEISFLFSYLLYNGYFSITADHKFRIENRLVIPEYFCFDLFHGGGVCLNSSDMLTDILVDAGYQASVIFNVMGNDLTKDYKSNIEVQCEKPKLGTKIGNLFSGFSYKKVGNHACTLIIERDKPYIFDSTNITMFKCVNNKEAVHSLGMGKLVLKPYVSCFLASDDMNYEAIKNLCLRDDYSSPYTRKDFIFTSEECIEKFNSNQNVINDFREEIFPYIDGIVQDTKVKQKRK